MLYVNVPETSGIDVTHFSSPVVTLGRYDGHFNDSNAPGWTKLAPGTVIDLRQPSSAVAELFAELAWWPENNYIVSCYLVFSGISLSYCYDWIVDRSSSLDARLVIRCFSKSRYYFT